MRSIGPRPPGTITVAEAAKLLMVKPRWVQQLAAEGHVPRADRGLYPLVGLVQGYIRYLREENRESSRLASETRIRDARANEIQLRIDRETNKLVPTAKSIEACDYIFGHLVAELHGVPAVASRDLSVRRQVEEAIRTALGNCAERCREAASALREGREPAPLQNSKFNSPQF